MFLQSERDWKGWLRVAQIVGGDGREASGGRTCAIAPGDWRIFWREIMTVTKQNSLLKLCNYILSEWKIPHDAYVNYADGTGVDDIAEIFNENMIKAMRKFFN